MDNFTKHTRFFSFPLLPFSHPLSKRCVTWKSSSDLSFPLPPLAPLRSACICQRGLHGWTNAPSLILHLRSDIPAFRGGITDRSSSNPVLVLHKRADSTNVFSFRDLRRCHSQFHSDLPFARENHQAGESLHFELEACLSSTEPSA